MSNYPQVGIAKAEVLWRYKIKDTLVSDASKLLLHHNRKMDEFLKGVVQLIGIGATAEIVMYEIDGLKEKAEQARKAWKSRLEQMKPVIENALKKIVDNWKTQAEDEIKTVALNNQGIREDAAAQNISSKKSTLGGKVGLL